MPQDDVRLLGVTISLDLSLQRHVSNVSATSFYWLRQLRRVRRSLDSWVIGYTSSCIRDLPSGPVQCRTCRSHKVGHWHPAACYERCRTHRQWNKKVRLRPDSNLAWWLTLAWCGRWVTYKLGVIMHRCWHGKAPQYLVDCCTPVTDVGRQRLRSATQQLMVPWHRLSTVGRQVFAVHGPMVWNSLLDDLHAQQDYESFRWGHKTGFSLATSMFSALETSWQ